MPEVSVVMPVYNRAWCVRRAIDSVFSVQSPVALELIVIDDGSTDESLSEIETARKVYGSRLRVLQHADCGNHGIAASRNLGISEAHSELVAFLDSDDYYLPNRFEHSLSFLSRRPGVDVVVAPFEWVGSDASVLVRHLCDAPRTEEGMVSAFDAMLFRGLFWTMPVATVRKQSLLDVGGFESKWSLGEDTALWLRLAARGRVAVLGDDRPIAVVTRHDEHSWSKISENDAWLRFLEVLLDLRLWVNENKGALIQGALGKLDQRICTYLQETLDRGQETRIRRLNAWRRCVGRIPALTLEPTLLVRLAGMFARVGRA